MRESCARISSFIIGSPYAVCLDHPLAVSLDYGGERLIQITITQYQIKIYETAIQGLEASVNYWSIHIHVDNLLTFDDPVTLHSDS